MLLMWSIVWMKENSKEKAQCYGLKNGFLSCTLTKEVIEVKEVF